jgi:glucokinase
MQALSLDMGGTHIGCAVVRDGALLAESSISSESAQSLASLLPAIQQTLDELLRQAKTSAHQCAGVAVGFPGIVDFRTGAIYSTLKKYEDAQQMDLTMWSKESFGLPLRVENDARMALLGEHFAGAAQDTENVIMMTLGTGIGGAAMMHGHLLRGVHAQAGCLGGHLPVDFHGRTCLCGNIGCAEAEAAGWSMPLVAREWPGFAESSLAQLPSLGFRELFEHAAQGDRVATAVRDRCLEVWASNAVANIHAYDPEVVIIGGGVMRSAGLIVPFVQDYVNKHAWAGWGKPQVRAAKLGTEAGLLGAVPLLKEKANAAAL